LIEAAGGELSRADRGRMADHLMTCGDCAEEYRLLTALKPWAAEAARPIAPAAARSRPALVWPSLIPYAAAAALLVTALGLGSWALLLRNENQRLSATVAGPSPSGRADVPAVAPDADPTLELRRRLDEAVQRSNQLETELSAVKKEPRTSFEPQLNVPIVDLEPDALRGVAARPLKVVALPAGTEIVTLVLATTAADRPFTEYGLEIADRAGSIVWRGAGLRKSPFDTFTVALPRRLIPDGEYRVSLVGIDRGRREVLDRYAIRTETK
jgi:hypothetical protein